MKALVVVAMSGGVDSSVAAALLKEKGYKVIGITMCFNLPDVESKKPRCCGIQGIEDARRVAHKLGIKHYVLNMQKVLNDKVIKDFCSEYTRGRTPNPCIRCNQFVKFEALFKKAFSLGAQYLATGHYARIVKNQSFELRKARDRKKDQTYFLYRIDQGQLRHILFPLGNYTKDQVRQLARDFQLPVAEKKESQEICFLPSDNYHRFLKEFAPKNEVEAAFIPGPITDQAGNVLGQHKGIAFYTIGQRQGLGIAAGRPIYITEIDAQNNKITVGSRKDAQKREFLVKDLHFLSLPIKKKVVLKVKIRYNHPGARALIIPFKNKLKISFKAPQFAITPGQAAVFYDKDKVIAGGIIDWVNLNDKKGLRI